MSIQPESQAKRRIALTLAAIFFTQFISWLVVNARNIAQPTMIAELNGIASFSWLMALPALSGAVGTLLSGKLSDMYGRRVTLLACIIIFAVGLGIASTSQTMTALIVAQTLMSFGHFPIIPLCFLVVGDLFAATERAKWTGLLNISTLAAALIGPVLGGFITETALGWRAIYWGAVPLVALSAVLVAFAVPNHSPKIKQKVDFAGLALMVIASTTLLFGVSWLNDPHKLSMALALLVASFIAWVCFIVMEQKAEAPILEPQVLFNRTFTTAGIANFLSVFGLLGIMAYSPIFAQSIMAVSPTTSGSMLSPHTMIVAVMGIVAGFWVARSANYKGLYLLAYVVATFALFVMWRFSANTPIWVYVVVTSAAGFGIGMLGTLNTLIAQQAVPKSLIGVAVGAMFFFQMVALTIAPAILGLVQNSLPNLADGLKAIFLLGAVAMLLALGIISTLPKVQVNSESH